MACRSNKRFSRTASHRFVLATQRLEQNNLILYLSGAISDSSTSKYRRRYWIVLSTIVLVFSTLVIAYCQPIAAFFVDILGGGVGDWDPERRKEVKPS